MYFAAVGPRAAQAASETPDSNPAGYDASWDRH